jgi:hypothetical protein
VSDLTIYSIVGIAATLRKWKEFRHQTGQWPVLSILAALFGITCSSAAQDSSSGTAGNISGLKTVLP